MDVGILTSIALAIPLFAVTNIDDIFVLIGFFADRRFQTGEVLIGQFIGIAGLIAVSVIAALIALVMPPEYIGLLGLAPIAIGLKKLHDLWSNIEEEDDVAHHAKGYGLGNVIAVMTVTVANGGDNIGVYAPLFAVRSLPEIVTIITVFLFMTVIWCAVSYWMVNHPTIGQPIRKYGTRLLPFALIAIGVMVLHEAGTVSHFLGNTEIPA